MKGKRQLLGPFGFGTYATEVVDGRLQVSPIGESPDGILCPGFIDLHIHGVDGLDVSENPDRLSEIETSLLARGYEYWSPTTASVTREVALAVLENSETLNASVGVHLEGPFLSKAYPGAQPQDALSEIDRENWSEVFDHPGLSRITLAPELEGANDLIRDLSQRGISVSIGHTDCTAEQANRAVESGAEAITHVFNAMRPFHHREPGPLAALIENNHTIAEFIYDGNHISRSALELCRRIVGPNRLVAVSDSTKATGLDDGTELTMWGQPATVQDAEVRLSEGGVIAGSAQTLDQIFPRLVADFGAEFAILTCAVNPAAACKKSLQRRAWLDMSVSGEIREIHHLQLG